MTEDEFLQWSAQNGMDFGGVTERLYRANSGTALLAVQAHPFIKQLEADLRVWDDQERARTGAPLLMTLDAPQLLQKPFSSVRNKCFRKNCAGNKAFPVAPPGGWITPTDLYSRLNDLIRGTLVCKYVDGPATLAKHLHERAAAMGLQSKFDAESRDQGYYAYHFYVHLPIQLLQTNWDEAEVSLQVELQISTQLQEVMRKVTHDFYEDERDSGTETDASWKWAIDTNRFRAGYVSHTLHLLESIIVQLRDDSFAKKQAKE